MEKVERKDRKRERSAAAFLTRPASLSCENIVCTQCMKGCNSLGELGPGHKHSHGLWTTLEPVSGVSCVFSPVEQNSERGNSERTLSGTDQGFSYDMYFLLMAVQQILCLQVKHPLLGEHRLQGHVCPSSYHKFSSLSSVASGRAINFSELHPIKPDSTPPDGWA